MRIEESYTSPTGTYTWTADSNTNHSPSYYGGKNYLSYWHTKADEQSVKDYNASNPKDKTFLKTTSTGVFNFYNTTTGKWETNIQELNGLTETKTIGPVVSLDSDIQLELNSTQVNTYDIK